MHNSTIANPVYRSLTDQQFSEMDQFCDRFDQELVNCRSPRIETFLAEAPEAARDSLLAELLAMEIEYRVRHGNAPERDEYVRRFPQQEAIVANFFGGVGSTQIGSGETMPARVHALPDLENFRLIQEIGRGGMGVVWLAEQLQPVKRRVALKLIRSEWTSKDAIARFDAEKQALAMMDHPNIARVLDAGTRGNSRPYIVMELVDGVPITQYCDDNKLSVGERLKLFVSVCKAVQHAHQKGIIHRDLKPTNVLVTVIDGEAVPKVIDFGLAKAVEHQRELTDATLLTEFGKVVGTVQYMSPEQAELKGQDAQDIDTRTDVYSLGVMLYELLTGSTPLNKEVLERSALLKVLKIIREDEPPRPSNRLSSSSNEVNSAVSDMRRLHPARLRQLLKGDLDWVVMKALEKEPDRRYQTAHDFAQDVSNYLLGETVTARPPSTWYQVQKSARRNRGLVAALTAIGLALIIGIVGTSYGLIRANEKAAEADTERGKAKASEKVALAEKANAETNEQRALRNEERAIEAEGLAAEEAQRARDSEASATFQLALARFDANRALDARRLLHEVPPEYRDTFEWNYAKRRFQGSDVTCYGHTSRTYAVAFTPDGKRVFSGNGDATIKVWDAVTGQELRTLNGHTRGVMGLDISSDGTRVASGSYDSTVKIWDAESGEVIRTMNGHSDWVNFVAFSPDGNRIASASKDKTVKIWNAATGEEIFTITGHSASVTGIAFSPDGGQLASSSSADGSTRIWDSKSGELITIVRENRLSSFGVAFSPDGSRLVTISYGTFKVWDTKTWQPVIERIGAHNRELRCVAFSPDGSQFAISGEDPIIQIRDTQTGREIASFCGHASTVASVAFSPDGSRLASGSDNGSVKLWDVAGGTNDLTIRAEFRPNGVTFSDDDTQFAYCGRHGLVVLCDARTSEIRFQMKGHASDKDVDELAFNPDGTRLITAGNDGFVGVWDTATGESVAMLAGHRSQVRSVAFSPDGTQFASASWDGTAKLWDANTLEETATLTGHHGGLYCVAFNPDGSRLATASRDGTLKSWDARTGEELKTFTGHNGRPRSVAFGPRGERMISAGNAPKVRVWDVASGESTVSGHVNSSYVFETTFSPNGTRFVTAGTDPGIHLYDSSTGQDLMTFQLPPSGSGGVRFSSNGRRLAAAAGGLEFVRIWDAPENHETTFLGGHTDTVTRVTFSADGSRIYSESENEKLVWDVATLVAEQLSAGRTERSEVPAAVVAGAASLHPLIRPADQSGPGSPAILDDADWKPPETAVRTSTDGRWFVTTESKNIVLVDLEFKNTRRERAYRETKARFNPLWHQQQAEAAVTAENWYAAVFHYAWLLRDEPNSLAHDAGLQTSYRRLNATTPAEVESLSRLEDRTGSHDGLFLTHGKKGVVAMVPATPSNVSDADDASPTPDSSDRGTSIPGGQIPRSRFGLPLRPAAPDLNHALYLDGASCVDLGNLPFYRGSFTADGRIRLDLSQSAKADDRNAVFTVRAANSDVALAAEVRRDGRLRVIHRNPPGKSGGVELISRTEMPDGKWHHFAVVKSDDDMLHLYIDGSLEASSEESVSDFGETSYTVSLGMNTEEAPRYFRGLMDDVRFWSDARTTEQVISGMNSPIDPAGPGLVAAYEFDQVSSVRVPSPGSDTSAADF